MLDISKLRLTQPSLARSGAELGKSEKLHVGSKLLRCIMHVPFRDSQAHINVSSFKNSFVSKREHFPNSKVFDLGFNLVNKYQEIFG